MTAPDLSGLVTHLKQQFSDTLAQIFIKNHELTIEISPAHLLRVARVLRDDLPFKFEQLMDVCGVDYLHYGLSEWQTEQATQEGFSRAVSKLGEPSIPSSALDAPKTRFAVVYHLLSITHNHRLRLKVFLPEENPRLDSVTSIWPVANWYEREVFDLFGFGFDNHPDLRRILTDYEFVGHPLRKDFPLSGHVELRYSATDQRVIYEPVRIEPRVGVPKTIREDHRYTRLNTNPDTESAIKHE